LFLLFSYCLSGHVVKGNYFQLDASLQVLALVVLVFFNVYSYFKGRMQYIAALSITKLKVLNYSNIPKKNVRINFLEPIFQKGKINVIKNITAFLLCLKIAWR